MILKRKYLIKKKNAYIINTNTLMISNKQMTIYVLCINLIYFPYCRNYAGIVVNKKKNMMRIQYKRNTYIQFTETILNT